MGSLIFLLVVWIIGLSAIFIRRVLAANKEWEPLSRRMNADYWPLAGFILAPREVEGTYAHFRVVFRELPPSRGRPAGVSINLYTHMGLYLQCRLKSAPVTDLWLARIHTSTELDQDYDTYTDREYVALVFLRNPVKVRTLLSLQCENLTINPDCIVYDYLDERDPVTKKIKKRVCDPEDLLRVVDSLLPLTL